MNIKFLAAMLIAAVHAAALPASAADGIRPGKWEYMVTTQLPQMPPGAQLPPNAQMPAGAGMSVTHTSCVTSGDPADELAKPHGPGAAQSRCSVEKMDRRGDTLSWVTNCATPDGTSRSEGSARYNADRIEANSRTRTTRQNGQSLEVSNHITGRYLGRCDGR